MGFSVTNRIEIGKNIGLNDESNKQIIEEDSKLLDAILLWIPLINNTEKYQTFSSDFEKIGKKRKYSLKKIRADCERNKYVKIETQEIIKDYINKSTIFFDECIKNINDSLLKNHTPPSSNSLLNISPPSNLSSSITPAIFPNINSSSPVKINIKTTNKTLSYYTNLINTKGVHSIHKDLREERKNIKIKMQENPLEARSLVTLFNMKLNFLYCNLSKSYTDYNFNTYKEKLALPLPKE